MTHVAFQPTKMSNTIIVFDYDDTLFPTTKYNEIMARPLPNATTFCQNKSQHIMSKMTEKEMIEWIKLSQIALNLLSSYIQKYSPKNICIVSASSNNWIQKSLLDVYQIGSFSQIYHSLFNHNSMNDENKLLMYHPSLEVLTAFKTETNYDNISQHPCFIWKYKIFKQICFSK